MESPTAISFRFSDLPTELALLILKYAAQPTFAPHAPYTIKNPYSSTLSLSRVSKIVRRTVMPEILHMVLLAEPRQVTAFICALRMQKTYVDQQQHDLSLNYAACVHKMLIGEFRGPLRGPNAPFINFIPFTAELDSGFDISLLAPVILAAPSLVINFGSLDILFSCLKHTCNSDVDYRNSPLPWSTKSLTFSGNFSRQWWPFLGSVYGYSFLASIQHLTLHSYISLKTCLPSQCDCVREIKSRHFLTYIVPMWMARAPIKGLETFSLAIPHVKSPAIGCAISDMEIWVKLVTFPGSVLPDPWTQEEMKAFVETGLGVGTLPWVTLPVFLSHKLLEFQREA